MGGILQHQDLEKYWIKVKDGRCLLIHVVIKPWTKTSLCTFC